MVEKYHPLEELKITEEGVRASMLELAKRAEAEPDLAFFKEFQSIFPEANIYLVGGIVRDCAMGLPCKDYDFVIEGSSQEALESFLEERGKIVAESDRTTAVYKFVPSGSKTAYDIALARIEKYDEDSRKPEVETDGISIEEDLSRRDFTINAMALKVFGNGKSEVTDPYGGAEDLNRQLIRAVGEPRERFLEDPLRMLRGIRFACRFGYAITPETFQAIQANAAEINHTEIVDGKVRRKVSYERFGKELTGGLTADPVRFFDLMNESGLMYQALPEVAALKGVLQPKEFHSEGDVLAHTRLTLANLPAGADDATVWAALLHDIGKRTTYQSAEETGNRIRFNGHAAASAEMVRDVLTKFAFPNTAKDEIVWLVANHMLPLHNFKDMRLSKQKELVRNPYFKNLIALAAADAKGSVPEIGQPDLTFLERINQIIEMINAEEVEEKPREIMRGKEMLELIERNWPDFDMRRQAPIIGKLLREVNEAYQDGEINDQAAAAQYAIRLIDKARQGQ